MEVNEHILTQEKPKSYLLLEQASSVSLFLIFFTLPLNDILNVVFVYSFLIFSTIKGFVCGSFNKITLSNKDLKKTFILSTPFWLALFSLIFHDSFLKGIRGFDRLIPLLMFAIFITIDKEFFRKYIYKSWWFFILGVLLAALTSWAYVVWQVVLNNESFTMLITPMYSNHNLTEFINIHTPYLALYVNASIGFLVYQWYLSNKNQKIIITIIIGILVLFLFHLMARNALFCFVAGAFIFFIKTKNVISLTAMLLLLAGFVFIFYKIDKNFYRDRFVRSINFFENKTIFSKKDDRFARWNASIEIFKRKPFLGVGRSKIKNLRKKEYIKNLDSVAYNESYNAHNQFIEYLSTYGLLGGAAFVVLIWHLFGFAVGKKSYLLFFWVSCFFVSGFTESVLYRNFGLVFYSILFISLVSFDHRKNWNLKTAT